jgi:predicted protein tyrosine phosphatase
MRSATAETIFATEGYTVKSAGTEETATVPLSNEIILWADLIFVMEEGHKVIINTYFSDVADNKNIIVLDIPDNYHYMEQELVKLLIEKVTPHL